MCDWYKDILVKTLIAGPYPFDMHEIIEISHKMQILDIFDEYIECIGIEKRCIC